MRLSKYEHRRQPPLSRREFARRVWGHGAIALLAVGIALFIGVCGYHFLGGLAWTDSLVNASMILGGMGPVDALNSDGAKVFAACYALFSGLFFIALMGFVLAPFAHRMLHFFHWEEE